METWFGNRRSLIKLAAASLAGGVVRRLLAQSSLSVVQEVARQRPNASVASSTCRYTVNATITLAGVPLFSKKNVGGAYVSIEESSCPECTVTALQFAAGSWPERLKGFNRFGMTQEAVREQNGGIAESAYVSFMSSSPEKNLSEARQAFSAQEVVPLSIAIGRSAAKGCAAQILHDKVPGTYSWRNCQDIIERLNQQPQFSAESLSSSVDVLPTFLFAVRRAMLTNNGMPVRYAHNAKQYQVKTSTETAHAGHEVVIGRISSDGDHGQTEFNLLLPAGNPSALPIRIQWRARSFLVLTLEADNSAQMPGLRCLLNREQA
jgi:hypothetical protein